LTLAVRRAGDTTSPDALKPYTRPEPSGTKPSAQVFGPTTPGRILGKSVDGPDGLSIASAPAFVIKSQPRPGLAQYVVLIDRRLSRRGLMDLLFAMAPYKAHGPDSFNRLLDNWRIFERAETSSGSMSLWMNHADSLGGSWRIFAEHRRPFLQVLEDRTEQQSLTPVIRWDNTKGRRSLRFGGLTPSETALLNRLANETEAAPEDQAFDPLLGFLVIPYLVPELRKNWPAWKPLVKGGKSNYIGPASVPVMALLHRSPILRSDFIRAAEAFAEVSNPSTGSG
jgi:hypothetical protein